MLSASRLAQARDDLLLELETVAELPAAAAFSVAIQGASVDVLYHARAAADAVGALPGSTYRVDSGQTWAQVDGVFVAAVPNAGGPVAACSEVRTVATILTAPKEPPCPTP